MNRPRKENETFEQYRDNLIAEENVLQWYCKGRFLWLSKNSMPTPASMNRGTCKPGGRIHLSKKKRLKIRRGQACLD
jgi:hypothetical protein